MFRYQLVLFRDRSDKSLGELKGLLRKYSFGSVFTSEVVDIHEKKMVHHIGDIFLEEGLGIGELKLQLKKEFPLLYVANLRAKPIVRASGSRTSSALPSSV